MLNPRTLASPRRSSAVFHMSSMRTACAGLEGSSRLQRLCTFMPYAAEQTRQAQRDAGSPLKVDIVRSALKLTRQVGT